MEQQSSEHVFHRPPRAWPAPVPAERIAIAPPPTEATTSYGGFTQLMFPLLGGLGIFAFALVYPNRLFLYVAIAMVALSILMVVAMRVSQRRQGKKSARRQRRRYRAYLTEQDGRLHQIAAAQRAAAERLYPDPPLAWGAVLRREHLWERRPKDEDFATVRVGRGPTAHVAEPHLDLGHNPLAEYEERLVEEARELVARWETLAGVPVAIDLGEASVLSVVGPVGRGRALTRSLLVQLAADRAPLDLLLAASFAPEAAADWDWMKWLPHTRTAGADSLLLTKDAAELAALLDEQVAPRVEQRRTLQAASSVNAPDTVEAPLLVLVLDGFGPRDPRARLPLLREALSYGHALRVIVVCLVETPHDEPAEARLRMHFGERGPASVVEAGPGGRVQDAVNPDEVAVGSAEAVARALAPVRLEEPGSAGSLGGDVRLAALLGLESIEAVDPEVDWQPRPRGLALQAPLGLTVDGEPLVLDLKQSAEGGMGPHGLLIGMTGTGKSELLRTLVAGLAITHSPEELAFVFIDYKGGAALAELEGLPHTAGMITNLSRDLRLIDRMHSALYGEQERRQTLLRTAGNLDDIRAYHTRRASDATLPPLPNLLVVIDEFGELLASRPDFVELFASIARVGRSLGIHLLFSSQRYDEGRLRGMESNLSYRLCLRTTSSVDSKAVLGTADAYVLPPTPGLGYLKVDTSIYERFKTAWVSRPYERPQDSPQLAAPVVTTFEPRRRAAESDIEAPSAITADGPTEMQVVVERLRSAGAARRVHQVWVPPLAEREPLDAVTRQPPWWDRDASHDPLTLAVTIGTVDHPREQRTGPLQLDLSGPAGHLAVVGAPQSGKSTVLRTLTLALARTYTPEEVHVYGIDLGGGVLRGLTALPHVGTIAGKTDRELVRQLVRHARRELERREAAFRRLGLDTMADARARRGADGDVREAAFADLFLLVDGWAAVRRDFQELDFEIEELMGAGLNYGIHVVITASRWAEMRAGVSDSAGSRIELALNDPLESAVGRKQAEALPADTPGRGLLSTGHEVQVSLPRLDGATARADLSAGLAAAAANISGRWRGAPAPPARVLPLRLLPEDVSALPGGRGVPIGVEELELESVQLDLLGADPHLLILGDAESGRTTLLRAFVRALAAREAPEDAEIILVDPRRGLGDLAELPHVTTYAANGPLAAEAATRLATIVAERLPSDAAAAHVARGPSTWPGPHYYLIVDDYDVLMGPQGSPLAALTGLLAHGRDAGVHVILARRVAGTTRGMFESFFQHFSELRPTGIILSGDTTEGPLIDGHRAVPLPPGRGLLIRRGTPAVLIQTVLAEPDADSLAPDDGAPTSATSDRRGRS